MSQITETSQRSRSAIVKDKLDAHDLDKDIEKEVKKLESAGSIDSKSWTKLEKVSRFRHKRAQISMRLLRDELETGEFEDPEAEVRRVEAEERLYGLEASIFKQQASRTELFLGEDGKNRTSYSMQLWLGTETEAGERSRSIQEEFREELIRVCNSKEPDPTSDNLWCPILASWIDKGDMRAAHIFDYASGQEAMDEIFGREEGNLEELNEVSNGLMLSKWAKEKIAQGDIVIVPNVPDVASREEVEWIVPHAILANPPT